MVCRACPAVDARHRVLRQHRARRRASSRFAYGQVDLVRSLAPDTARRGAFRRLLNKSSILVNSGFGRGILAQRRTPARNPGGNLHEASVGDRIGIARIWIRRVVKLIHCSFIGEQGVKRIGTMKSCLWLAIGATVLVSSTAHGEEFTTRQRNFVRAATLAFFAEMIECARYGGEDTGALQFCDRLKSAPDDRMIELLECDPHSRCGNPLPRPE